MKKKIIVLCGVMIFALLGFIGTTVAWLTSTGSKEQTVTVGKVQYTLPTTLAVNATVVPGDSIFTSEITFDNTSTVTSQIRIKMEVTSDASPALTVDKLKITMPASPKWVLEDDYYYYGGSGEGVGEIAANTDVATDFFTSIVIDGSKVGNEHAGKTITFTITLEAKQSEHVLWTDLATYSFETGLANS